MTAPALYRHTDRLPDGTTAYGCHTLARDGRTPVPLGCGHRTPREAIAHKADVFVPTSRSAQDPNGTPTRTNRAATSTAAPALIEAPEDMGRLDSPAAVPPAAAGLLPRALGHTT